jgi:hypothetical protein
MNQKKALERTDCKEQGVKRGLTVESIEEARIQSRSAVEASGGEQTGGFQLNETQ